MTQMALPGMGGGVETLFVELVARIDNIESKVSSALTKAEHAAAAGEAKVNAKIANIGGGATGVAVSSNLAKISANVSNSADDMQSSVSDAADSVEDSFSRIQQAAGASTVVLAAITALGGAMVALGVKSIQAAAQMETTQIAFQQMFGSADKANKTISELADFAEHTPFNFTQLTAAARKFVAFGVDAEQIVPLMTNIGDAVAKVGGNSQSIESVTRALTQMLTKGKLSAEEMNQLADAGIIGWPALARAMGKSMAEVQDMAEKGQISGAKAATLLVQELGKESAGFMAAQGQSLEIIMSNMQDAFDRTLIAVGKTLDKTFDVRGNLGRFVDAMSGLRKMLEDVAASGGNLTDVWNKVAPPWLRDNIIVIAGAIVGSLLPAFITIAGAITGAAVALAPFVALGAAVAYAATLIFRDWSDVVRVFTQVKDAVQYILFPLQGLSTDAPAAIREMASRMGEALTFVGNLIGTAVESWAHTFIDWIGPRIPDILKGLGTVIGTVAGWIGQQVPVIVTALIAWGTAFVDWIGPQIPGMLEKAGELLGAFVGWAAKQGQTVLNALGSWALALINWIVPQIPGMLEKLGSFLGALVVGIGDQTGKIAKALEAWAKSFIDWIVPNIPEIEKRVRAFADKVYDVLMAEVPKRIGKLGEMSGALIQGIVDSSPFVIGGLLRLLDGILKFIIDHAEEITRKLVGTWIPAFVLWVAKAATAVVRELPVIIAEVGVWIVTTGIPRFYEFGDKVGKGFVEGLFDAIKEGVKATASSVIWDVIASMIPGGAALKQFIRNKVAQDHLAEEVPYFVGAPGPASPSAPSAPSPSVPSGPTGDTDSGLGGRSAKEDEFLAKIAALNKALEDANKRTAELEDQINKPPGVFSGFNGDDAAAKLKKVKSALEELGISVEKMREILGYLDLDFGTITTMLESIGVNSWDAHGAFEALGISAQKLASFLSLLGITGDAAAAAFSKIAQALADKKAIEEDDKAAEKAYQADQKLHDAAVKRHDDMVQAAQDAENYRKKLLDLVTTITDRITPVIELLTGNILGGLSRGVGTAAAAALNALINAGQAGANKFGNAARGVLPPPVPEMPPFVKPSEGGTTAVTKITSAFYEGVVKPLSDKVVKPVSRALYDSGLLGVDYRQVARDAAAKYGFNPDIFERQINQESGFNPNRTGADGEIGIAQIMPATARAWGVNAADPVAALDAAAKHMAEYLAKYGSYQMALAAYNAGEGAVQSGRIPASTQGYINAIMGGSNPPVGSPNPGAGGTGGTPEKPLAPIPGYTGPAGPPNKPVYAPTFAWDDPNLPTNAAGYGVPTKDPTQVEGAIPNDVKTGLNIYMQMVGKLAEGLSFLADKFDDFKATAKGAIDAIGVSFKIMATAPEQGLGLLHNSIDQFEQQLGLLPAAVAEPLGAIAAPAINGFRELEKTIREDVAAGLITSEEGFAQLQKAGEALKLLLGSLAPSIDQGADAWRRLNEEAKKLGVSVVGRSMNDAQMIIDDAKNAAVEEAAIVKTAWETQFARDANGFGVHEVVSVWNDELHQWEMKYANSKERLEAWQRVQFGDTFDNLRKQAAIAGAQEMSARANAEARRMQLEQNNTVARSVDIQRQAARILGITQLQGFGDLAFATVNEQFDAALGNKDQFTQGLYNMLVQGLTVQMDGQKVGRITGGHNDRSSSMLGDFGGFGAAVF